MCAIFAWGNTNWSTVGNFWQVHACREMVSVNSRNNSSIDEAIVTGKPAPLCVFQHMLKHRKRIAIMIGRLCSKCDGTRAKTRFRLSAKRTSLFKSAGMSVQSTAGSGGVHISGSYDSNAGYTMFWGSVKGTGYPLHSPVSPSLPRPCITVCSHISTGLYSICVKLLQAKTY
jgi:hypothetical protein